MAAAPSTLCFVLLVGDAGFRGCRKTGSLTDAACSLSASCTFCWQHSDKLEDAGTHKTATTHAGRHCSSCLVIFWRETKWVSMTHGATFLCQVWWSQLQRILRYCAEKHRQTVVVISKIVDPAGTPPQTTGRLARADFEHTRTHAHL